MDRLGYTRAFRPEQQDVVGLEFRRIEAHRAQGGQKDDAPGDACFKCRPIGVARHLGLRGIVHPGACQGAVGKGESHRFDQIDGHAETRRQPQDGADVSGDVGLMKCDAHKNPLAKRHARVYQARNFRGDGRVLAGARPPKGWLPKRSAAGFEVQGQVNGDR